MLEHIEVGLVNLALDHHALLAIGCHEPGAHQSEVIRIPQALTFLEFKHNFGELFRLL